MKLTPPGRASANDAGQGHAGLGALLTIGSSLAIVLGLFVIVVWIMRRTMPASAALLPSEVVQILGRTPIAQRHQLQVLRFGSKLVLISVTPDGAETLAEITDPQEVTHLAGLCQQRHLGSSTTTFRKVLEQLGGERTHGR